MKNNDEIRQANRKALPKFLLIMLGGVVFGMVVGFASLFGLDALGEDNIAGALAKLGTGLAAAAPWLLAACGGVELIADLILYRRASAIIRNWDGEDETVSDRAEKPLNLAMWISSMALIAAFFLMTASYSSGVASKSKADLPGMLGGVIAFVAVLALTIILQQRLVDLTKRLYPEKKASVYDTKFQKEWFAQCDEAEKAQIGQCAYHAYNAANRTCMALWLVFTLTALFLGTGVLPVLTVCVIWAVSTSVFCWWASRLGAPSAL